MQQEVCYSCKARGSDVLFIEGIMFLPVLKKQIQSLLSCPKRSNHCGAQEKGRDVDVGHAIVICYFLKMISPLISLLNKHKSICSPLTPAVFVEQPLWGHHTGIKTDRFKLPAPSPASAWCSSRIFQAHRGFKETKTPQEVKPHTFIPSDVTGPKNALITQDDRHIYEPEVMEKRSWERIPASEVTLPTMQFSLD